MCNHYKNKWQLFTYIHTYFYIAIQPFQLSSDFYCIHQYVTHKSITNSKHKSCKHILYYSTHFKLKISSYFILKSNAYDFKQHIVVLLIQTKKSYEMLNINERIIIIHKNNYKIINEIKKIITLRVFNSTQC